MISCSDDGSLKIWDLRESQLVYTLRAHDGSVCSTSFSASGALLGNAAVHPNLFPAHYNMRIRPGQHFASGGEDERVLVWAIGDAVLHSSATDTQTCSAVPSTAHVAAAQQLQSPAVRNHTAAKAQQPRAASGEHASEHCTFDPNSLTSLLSRLDLITSTLAALEKRLTATEARCWPVNRLCAQTPSDISCMC